MKGSRLVGTNRLHIICYADGNDVLIAESEEDLQRLCLNLINHIHFSV